MWFKRFSQNFQTSFTGNWNRKREPGNDIFGRVSGYSPILSGGVGVLCDMKVFSKCDQDWKHFKVPPTPYASMAFMQSAIQTFSTGRGIGVLV